MEIDKSELQTMVREYWAVNNNDLCEAMTIIFLRRLGINDVEISNWFDHIDFNFPKVTKANEKEYAEAIQDTKNYYNY